MNDQSNAVVVGYGPGIGAAVAEAFGQAGHTLSLIARDGTKVQAAAADWVSRGHKAIGLAANAGESQALRAALREARDALGDPEVLVYNAAAWRPGPVLNLTPIELVQDFEVCVAGALTAASAVVESMRSRGRGSILFTGGGLALHPSRFAPSLSIGKAGIRALALMLADELAPSGVKVGTVTVAGTVADGTSLSPTRIAQAFLELHHNRTDFGRAEIVLHP